MAAARPFLPTRLTHPSGRRPVVLGVALTALAVVAGCSEPETSGAQFCTALQDSLPVLNAKIDDPLAIDTLVKTYESLDERTPLAIEESWHDLTVLVQTASTVAADDSASVQAVSDLAYASERSAREVSEWVQSTCGFSMPKMSGVEGPVGTQP